MSDTKKFTLRTLLTVTTGRLLTEGKGDRDNGIGDLYELLGWMTDDSPFTHQLGRFSDECKPHILAWFPEIAVAGVCLDKLDAWLKSAPTCPSEGIKMWLAELKMMFPEIKDEYEVPKIPKEYHTPKNPISELAEMMQ